MLTTGRIADNAASTWQNWEPGKRLPSHTLNEVRFSRGFLRSDVSTWFPGFKSHWVPLLRVLDASVDGGELSVGVDFPENLDRVVAMEVDNEAAVVGIDAASEAAIVETIGRGLDEKAGEAVIDYLQRRLLSSISRSWGGTTPLTCMLVPSGDDIEVSGTVNVRFHLSGRPCSVWFGLGPTLVERFDQLWRERIVSGRTVSETTHRSSVQLAQFVVAPEMVTDFLRPGITIVLDQPLSAPVDVYLDGDPWVTGSLGQFNNRYAVTLTGFAASEKRKDHGTRIEVEIAQAEFDEGGRWEHAQLGAVLLTRGSMSNTASLLISDEVVGSASIGQVGEKLALRVLPK
jgi:hypothetical protein